MVIVVRLMMIMITMIIIIAMIVMIMIITIMIESSPNKQRDSEARTNRLLLLSKTFHFIDNNVNHPL